MNKFHQRLLPSIFIVLLLGGCMSTGISIGPVFIPVETGIGKNKKSSEKEPEAPKPKSAPKTNSAPKPKSAPQTRNGSDASTDEEKATDEEVLIEDEPVKA